MTSIEARQEEIAAWLEEKKPDLASTYRGALLLLRSAPDPGHERTRIMLVCHSMREVMNRLPTAVMLGRGSVNGERIKKHKKSADQVRELPKLRVDYPDVDLTQEAENILVPRQVAVTLGNLIDAAIYEDQRRLGDLAAFLTDDANPKHPAVSEWRDLSEYFTRWAHLRDQAEEAVPSDNELIQRVRVFEDHVDAIRLAFFESKAVIEDLLAAANQTVDEVQP